jgi:NOL1/NOP2/fmu family ribosome biogenesis protein/23S rRNA U2552 (ribose-2'-O)-methylase RlmE/FtsJ
MAVAEAADLAPGQAVLDLAASPGGKSTQISAAIGPTGLLVANEIHPARIKALGENLERWGAVNTVITNRSPEQIAAIPGLQFDRIVIDAPCSGEGLFRRDPAARAEWSPERVAGSAERQVAIVRTALPLLKPGGTLVYSTCTFNQSENERVIEQALAIDLDLILDDTHRLWPHKVRGEGHTFTRLHRTGELTLTAPPIAASGAPDSWQMFVADTFVADPIARLPGAITQINDRLALEPAHPVAGQVGKAVRSGLWLGDLRPGRFEPSHALALAIDPTLARNSLDLTVTQAHRWIAGEPISADGPSGWALITVEGYALGWGKRSGSTVKNHYPKGLRRPVPR